MKKVAGFCYILFRALFMATVWIGVVAAAVVCFAEALELKLKLKDLIVGIGEYTTKFGLLPYLFAVGMIGFRFLEDYLAQRKPMYLGLAELGAEIAVWLLKCDAAYIGVKVTCRLLLVLRDAVAVEGVTDFLAYLFTDTGLFLFFAVLLVALHALCTYLRRRKS